MAGRFTRGSEPPFRCCSYWWGLARATLLRRSLLRCVRSTQGFSPRGLCTLYFCLRKHKERVSGTTKPSPQNLQLSSAVPETVLTILKARRDGPGPGWGQQLLTRNEVPSGKALGLALQPAQRTLGQSLGHQEPVPSSVTGEPRTGVAVTTPPSGLCASLRGPTSVSALEGGHLSQRLAL